MKHPELRLCGLTAVKARFDRDPESVERLYFDRETSKALGEQCRALAAAKKVYRCIEAPELEKVGGTVHHGGVVAVVRARPLLSAGAREAKAWASRRDPILFLDRIGNAHNLGAIARTAGFFGVPRIVIADDPKSARPTDAAYRVAEGALEVVEVWTVPSAPTFLRQLSEAGYDVVGAAVRGGQPRAPGSPRLAALVLGNEEHGLSREVERACSRLTTIPGSGRVESLNVAAAASILIWELLRR